MRAISIKCPNCAASLQAGVTASTVTCAYCGTESQIQHRSRVLERTIDLLHLSPKQRAMPVPRQHHGVRWAAMVTLLPLAIAGVSLYSALGGVDVISHAVDTFTGEHWTYAGMGSTLLEDINGDGHPDIIGPIRYVQQDDSYYIAAFDGLTGSRIWKSTTFGTHDDAISGRTALHGRVVLQSDSVGNISGYATSDGIAKWKVSLGEKLQSLCADSPTSVALELTDATWKSLNLDDGKLSGLAKKPAHCAKVAIHREHSQTDVIYASDTHSSGRAKFKVEKMEVRDSVQLTHSPEFHIALGTKTPGTRVPMIALITTGSRTAKDSIPKKSNKRRTPKYHVLWASELPAVNPLNVKSKAPDLVAVNRNSIVSLYTPKQGEPRIVCFTREGGRRLWDSELPHKLIHTMSAIDMTAQRVFVAQWGRLDAFHTETGALVFSLGQ